MTCFIARFYFSVFVGNQLIHRPIFALIGNMGINICNLYSDQLDKHVYFCTGLVAF